VSAFAEMAFVARQVVRRGDALTDFIFFYAFADLGNLGAYLMAQDKRRSILAVPFQDVASAYPACVYLDKDFAFADFRHRHLLNPYVIIRIVHPDSHSRVILPEILALSNQKTWGRSICP
jgi:hypothetical protein